MLLLDANEVHAGPSLHPVGSARLHWFWDTVKCRSKPTETVTLSRLSASQSGHVQGLRERLVCPRTKLIPRVIKTYKEYQVFFFY